MNRLLRFVCFVLACCVSGARAQNIVFNDAFTGDALNAGTYPAVTATSTGWNVASNKNAPAPTESGGGLTINMAATTSGFIETQALFAPAPVQLLPGTYIELTGTFVPTYVVTNNGDNLVVGLFNSGGSAPAAGMLSSQLSSGLTNFVNGGARGWLGFNANIPLTGATAKMLTRPAQSGTTNVNQDVVFDGQSSGVGYASSATLTQTTAPSTTFTNGSTYTVDYKLSLSSDGNTLTTTCSVYGGAGTTGTGSNPLLKTYSATATAANLLTKSFDAFAFGWRADAGQPSNLKFSSVTVKTTGGAPWFVAQPPPSLLASLASSLSISTTVNGLVSTYQWQKSTDGGATFANLDPSANPSAATALLTLGNIQYADAGVYRLVAANAAGATTSSTVTVSVTANPVAPTIITPPASGTVLAGTPYAFSVVVNGTSPLTYQWQKSTDGVTYTPIAGATGTSYTIASPSLADEGTYTFTATNVAGSVTSAPATLTVNQPLAIQTQPVGATLNIGDAYTISVGAVGKPAPTYQWYLNGTALAGATSASYPIASASAAAAGIYTVVASNTAGDSVTSSGAAVAVLSPTLATTTMTPVATPTGVAPDTRLTLTFNQPIAVGIMGQIRIYDAANPTTPVDTIDLSAGTALMKSLRAAGPISTQLLPVQNKTIGGATNFNYYPITISGNTATIYPRNNVLAYGKNYYVVIDPGVFTDPTGLSFAGISGTSGWTFGTKLTGPVSSATWIVVAADGTGDFNTVQGALDFIPSGNTTPRTIYLRRGTYFEEVYFTGKHNLTFLGEDRNASIVAYPNNNNFNNVGGTYHRMVLQADHVNNVAFVNLTIQNTTPHGGAQAEALVLNGSTTAQAVVSNVNLVSYQDTLLANGQAYVTDSHISGDVDYMWGGGANFFNHCELTALTSGGYFTQIRNGNSGHGNVYLNCTLDAAPGITGMYLARIDPSPSGGFPYSEVVWLNCIMGSVSGSTYSTPVGAPGWLLNNTPDQTAASAPNVHFWEYNSHYADGTPLSVSLRIGASRQLTMANDATTIANYSTPSYVLGNNWTPALAPIIATQPTAQAVDSGSGFTLSVQAFGLPAVTYQWLLNGVAIPGATGASYTVSSAAGANAGTYAVVVSNGTSSLTSTAVPLIVHGAAPVIARQPTDTTGLLGATATLNVWALGDGPFTYQWSQDGAPIAGATQQSLRLTGLQASAAGNYSVAVTNAGGTTVSRSAALTTVAAATTLPTVPTIPAATFDVTSYGAVGDGQTDNTAAIQAAINAANAAGGGTVEIPAASAAYLCGPITLSSNLDLQVDGGATLQALPFGVYPKSYTVPAHFITFSSGAKNIEISGSGVIDGNGAAWWAALNDALITSRPRLIQTTKATNVLFTGVTFQNSPSFHLSFSGLNNDVTIFDVTVSAPGDSPNTDGMDLGGTNMLVQNCSVSDGDDDIVAKPGSVFCRNIYIANCAIGTGHGVSIGGQTNVGLDGMIVTNCTFNGTSSALRFKADPTQGGPVQNVTFSNLTMTNVQYPILFYSYYNVLGSPGATSGSSQITPAKVNADNLTPPNSLASATIPTWKNITVTNLTVTNASGYSTIWGLPLANALIANVTLDHVNIQGGAGLELYDAANIQLTGTNNVGPIIACNALAITGQPAGKTINVGDSVTFAATAVGGSGTNNTGLHYQWNLGGTPLVDGLQADGSTVSGSATATLTVANARATSAGNYTLTVSTTLDGYDVTAGALAANSLPVSATSSAAALVVNPLPATLAVASTTQTYDGTAKLPTVTTSPAGLAVTLTFNGSATAPIAAGSYAVVATIADPNYTAPAANGTLTIAPAALTVTAVPQTKIYGSADPVLAYALTTGALVGTDSFTGALARDAGENVGSYAIQLGTLTAGPNYAVSYVGASLTITKAAANVAVAGYTVTYDGTSHTATGSAVGVYGESLAGLNLAGTAHTNAGTYADAWTFTDLTGNYLSANGGVTDLISAAPATISLAPLAQAYDGTPKSVTATTSPAGLGVSLTYDGTAAAPSLPGDYTVVATITDPNYSGTETDTLSVDITALVRHGLTLDGSIDGSVQVLTGEATTLNGNAGITGDLLVPGRPVVQINGHPTFAGVKDNGGTFTTSAYTVSLNGGALLRYLVRGVDPLPLPTVPTPPVSVGTRDVVLNGPGVGIGDPSTLRDLTLNGRAGIVTIPAGTYGDFIANGGSGFVLGVAGATQPAGYNLQTLTLNGTAQLQIAGPVILTLANGLTVNASAGAGAHPEWLTIQVANGGVTLNGSSTLSGSVVAPNGTVTIGGNGALHGTVVADRLVINGNGVLEAATP